MTDSTTRSLLAVAFLVAGVFATGLAHGQESDEPLLIIPFEPVEDIIVTEPVEEEVPVADGPEEPAATGLEVVALMAVDTDSVGTLEEEDGGFRRDMWQESDGVLMGRLLGMIETGSGNVLNLSRRLLLTSSKPPSGMVDDWLGQRIGSLIALGLLHDADELMNRAGLRALETAGRLGRIDILFLAGDSKTACRDVRAVLDEEDVPSLAPALVFCQRLGGRHDAADLSLAVLQDTGLAVDPRFLALNTALTASQPASLETLDGATPLLFAMAAASGAGIPLEALEGASPALLRAVADRTDLPAEIRLAAAERCTARGIMSGAELGSLYREADVPADVAEIESGVLGRARLFQEAAGAVLVRVKARLIASLVHHGARDREPSAFRAAAMAAASELVSMTPENDLGWFSAQAALMLLAVGRPEEAAGWWPLIEQRAFLDESAAAEAAVLWPLLRLWMGENLPDDGDNMRRWWQTVAGIAPERALRLGGLYLVLMAALDDRAAEPLLGDVLTAWPGHSQPVLQGRAASSGLLVALEAASREGRLGETILLSIVLIGPDDPAGSDVSNLRAVIEALRQAGLERDARLLALEAAFANAV